LPWASSCDPYLGLFPYCIIDDVVVLDNLLLDGEREILHSGLLLLEIYVTQTAVEENLARVKLEHQTQLSVIDHVVPPQI
jgi:hypothetical protein